MKTVQKFEIGRPTLFQKRFCKMLIAHMTEGFTFTSFAGKAGVSRRTLYDWCRYYPDFLAAYETGYAAALLFYERQLLMGIQGKQNGNPTLLIFALKTRFHREFGIAEQNQITDVSKPIDISKINDPAELARLSGPPEDIRKGYQDLMDAAKKGLASMDRIMNSPLRDRTEKQDQNA